MERTESVRLKNLRAEKKNLQVIQWSYNLTAESVSAEGREMSWLRRWVGVPDGN